MFEVIPNRAISVETFHVMRLAGSSQKTFNFQVFTRSGSWNGWQSASAGWTKISEDGLTVTSTDPIAIPMSKMTPVTIYSGVTQSFYIASTSEFFISSEADAGTAASNSDVSLYTGWGISTRNLFGQPGSTKRRFYGNMIYSFRSDKPSVSPSRTPTMLPSMVPSVVPTLSFFPTLVPSMTPSSPPTDVYFPSDLPSSSVNPSSLPSKNPSLQPSSAPTSAPTTAAPTSAPTVLEVPKLVFTIPSSISIQGFGVPQTSAEIATVVAITGPSIAALAQQNLNENQSVTVVILSINGIPVTSGSQSFTGRRLAARRLQGVALDIQYEIILEEICATTDCSDKDPEEIANLVYETVTESMQDEIASGAFATTLEQVAAEIGEILEITVEESNFSDLQMVVLSPGTPSMSPSNSFQPSGEFWYPSWIIGSYCLDDGNQPFYMSSNAAAWLYNNRDGCCTRYYSYDYALCMGEDIGAVGYYPAWDGTQKCLNDANVPAYMRLNPSQWLYDDIDSCCERYFSWIKADCISQSGSTASNAATNNWYVNHIDMVCEQDCPKDNGGSCGGLAPSYKTLYESPALCCKNTLPWITTSHCEAASSHITYSGTEKWYVDHHNNRCVQDCAISMNTTCGGIVHSAYVDMFDTAKRCCTERLGWMGIEYCEVESTDTATSAATSSVGSGGWYVNHQALRCVQDCVGTSPCGGLAKSWDEIFTSDRNCCSAKLWWLEASTCILA